jgi:hypothetical protein
MMISPIFDPTAPAKLLSPADPAQVGAGAPDVRPEIGPCGAPVLPGPVAIDEDDDEDLGEIETPQLPPALDPVDDFDEDDFDDDFDDDFEEDFEEEGDDSGSESEIPEVDDEPDDIEFGDD